MSTSHPRGRREKVQLPLDVCVEAAERDRDRERGRYIDRYTYIERKKKVSLSLPCCSCLSLLLSFSLYFYLFLPHSLPVFPSPSLLLPLCSPSFSFLGLPAPTRPCLTSLRPCSRRARRSCVRPTTSATAPGASGGCGR